MISLNEACQETAALVLRDPQQGEACHLHFNHEARTFTFKSLSTGESLRLPDIVEVVMNLRGMKQTV